MWSVVLSCALAVVLLGARGAGGQGQLLQTCPQGWVAWRQFCYLFVNSTKVTWEQARSECQDQQAALLRIQTADEYEFLRKSWGTSPPIIPVSDMYWTALNNLPMNQGAATKPEFMWGGNEFPLDSVVAQNWDKEPDNSRQKNCVMVNVQGTLAMSMCSDRNPYICEFLMSKDDICPIGWIIGYHHQYCYKVSNASDWTKWKNWSSARRYCQSFPNNKTTLIKVTNADVQNFLQERLPGVYNGRKGFWTGLNDIDHEGSFIWAGNRGTPMNVNNFDGMWRTEPDNLGGNEHCGAVLPPGRWNDRNCQDRLNYACRLSLGTASMEMNFGCGSWLRAGTKCVQATNVLKSWNDARAFCQQAGGDLLSFSSQTDADWITFQASNYMALRRYPGHWIGLNSRQNHNTFVWSDGSPVVPAVLYWDKEPNNDQNCATLNDRGFFADFDCSHVHAGTICEDPNRSVSGNCGDGWTWYGGHCYKGDLQGRTRDEAETFCNRTSPTYQGRLLALNSAAEKTWVLTQLFLNPPSSNRFWTGLVRRGGWMWQYDEDNQSPDLSKKLITWAEEPSRQPGEDCVEILANGRLNDAQCNNSRAFICQKPAPMPSKP